MEGSSSSSIENISEWMVQNRSLSDVLLACVVLIICSVRFFVGVTFTGADVISSSNKIFGSFSPVEEQDVVTCTDPDSDPDAKPVDPDDPDDPDASGGGDGPDPDERGKFGGGLVILFVNIFSSIATLIFVVVVLMEGIQKVLMTVICYECGKGCIYREYCRGLEESLSLKAILVVGSGLMFSNMVTDGATKGASTSLKQTEAAISLVLAVIRILWALIGPENNADGFVAMVILFSLACLACGKFLSMYRTRVSTDESELNEARILLAPVNILLAVMACIVYLTGDLLPNFSSKFFYSTVSMLGLGILLFTLQNFIFSGMSKFSVSSFIITPMMVSFLIPIQVALLYSYISESVRGYVTRGDEDFVKQWISQNGLVFCFLFMSIHSLMSASQSVGSLFSLSSSILVSSYSTHFDCGSRRLKSEKVRDWQGINCSFELSRISKHCFSSLLRIVLSALYAMTFGILFEAQVEFTFSILTSSWIISFLSLIGAFALTAGSNIETSMLTVGSGYLLANSFGPSSFLVAAACSFIGSTFGSCVMFSACKSMSEEIKQNDLGDFLSYFSPENFSSVFLSRVILFPAILLLASMGAKLRIPQSMELVLCAITISSGLSTILIKKSWNIKAGDTRRNEDICLPLINDENI